MYLKKTINSLIIIAVLFLASVPLFFYKSSSIGGTDDAAKKAIQEVAPGYTPWFQSFITPSGKEMETLFFTLQAAMGAGLLGYVIGYYKGRSSKEKRAEQRENQ